MTIPFCLTQSQFAQRFRAMLDKHSADLLVEIRALLSLPIGDGVTSASIVIFMDEFGERGPSFGLYFDGPNRRIDSSDDSIFPGRAMAIAEYIEELYEQEQFAPQYFSDKDFGALDLQTNITKAWFAEWWWKAGGWDYPVPVDITAHNDFGDGNDIHLAPGTAEE